MTFPLNRKQALWFYGIGLGLAVLLAGLIFQTPTRLRLTFLDVGQGDAILIQTPEDQTILVDAGAGTQILEGLGRKMGFFDRKIDLFVLSHPDRDHFAGMMDVMNQYTVGRILMSGTSSEDSLYDEFLARTQTLGIPIAYAESDQDFEISPNVYLDVLFPFPDSGLVGQIPEDKNNDSVVVRLVRKTADGWEPLALLNGDAEFKEEQKLMISGEDLASPILKLGHHGSKHATSEGFLAAADPQTVVVSAGAGNRYNHPNPETLERVKNRTVRRTDQETDITFEF